MDGRPIRHAISRKTTHKEEDSLWICQVTVDEIIDRLRAEFNPWDEVFIQIEGGHVYTVLDVANNLSGRPTLYALEAGK